MQHLRFLSSTIGIRDNFVWRLLLLFAVVVLTRDSGRTGKDTVWEWKLGVDGYTGENGRKDSKGDTAYGNRIHQRRNTRVRGQMDYRMDTGRRHMPMTVSSVWNLCFTCMQWITFQYVELKIMDQIPISLENWSLEILRLI